MVGAKVAGLAFMAALARKLPANLMPCPPRPDNLNLALIPGKALLDLLDKLVRKYRKNNAIKFVNIQKLSRCFFIY
jgi:hypothetical protein